MSEGSPGRADLARTLRDVELLLSRTGLDPAAQMDLAMLSFHTSLPEADVRRLLDGADVGVREVGAGEVSRRIQFLMATRLCEEAAPGGGLRKRPYTVAEVAAGIGMTPQWLNTLLTQRRESSPNLRHGSRIARFFDVPVNFLTDPPAEALNRVLRGKVLPRLMAVDSASRQAVTNRYAVRIQQRLGDVELDAAMEKALMLFVDGIARDSLATSGSRAEGRGRVYGSGKPGEFGESGGEG